MLSEFYGHSYKIYAHGDEHLPKIVDRAALVSEFVVFKIFSFKERFRYETKQREVLDQTLRQKEKSEKKLTTMVDLLSTRKQIAEKQRVKELEAEIEELRKAQKINFNLLHTRWIESGLGSKHPNVSRMLEYAALIPPSTAEIERIFSTMKLICTRLRKSLTSTNLALYPCFEVPRTQRRRFSENFR